MNPTNEEDVRQLNEIAVQLRKQCLIHLYLQSTSATLCHTIHNLISIPNIIIGGVLSITIFSTSNPVWKITTGMLAISSTVLSSLAKNLSPGERAHLHCNVVREYMSLLQDLNTVHTTTDVEEKKKVVVGVRAQLHKLFDIQPEPSKYAVIQFEKKYKKNIQDALYEDFETITVRNAASVQSRLSMTKPKRLSSSTTLHETV